MSYKLRLLTLAAALVAFSPLAMAQSSAPAQSTEQQSQAPQNEPGWNQPTAPAGCYNAPSATCGQ